MFARTVRNTGKVVLAALGLIVLANSLNAANENPAYLLLALVGLVGMLNPLAKFGVHSIVTSFTSRRMARADLVLPEAGEFPQTVR